MYNIDDLNFKEQAVVIFTLDLILKCLRNNLTYKPFQAVLVGCGGTGKTLLSVVRQYTKCNDTVTVAAPTMGAVYNVQGCPLS